jgi:hypothetical protein
MWKMAVLITPRRVSCGIGQQRKHHPGASSAGIFRRNKMTTPTLAVLNKNDNPAEFGMEKLGDDGQNQLWLHRATDKVANRFTDGGENVFWTDEIEGWNYSAEDAIPEFCHRPVSSVRRIK